MNKVNDLFSNIKQTDIDLPSNHKFGYFFTFVFLIASIYFYLKHLNFFFYIFFTASIIFFVITLIATDILKPLNKLWMGFGLILGKAISPIVMGVIFFIIFTPIGVLMRVFGRDELHINFKYKDTYWIKRNQNIQSNSFRNQF